MDSQCLRHFGPARWSHVPIPLENHTIRPSPETLSLTEQATGTQKGCLRSSGREKTIWQHPACRSRTFTKRFRNTWRIPRKAGKDHGFIRVRRCYFGDCDDPSFSFVEESGRFEKAVAMEARQ
jgi:hypothetical protein